MVIPNSLVQLLKSLFMKAEPLSWTIFWGLPYDVIQFSSALIVVWAPVSLTDKLQEIEKKRLLREGIECLSSS